MIPQLPGPLLAVAFGIILVNLASLDEHGIALIAPVPSGLPTPVAPSFDHIGALAPGAFAIAIMCFLETASVAGAVRRRDEPPIDNDQELAANGVACIAGAFFRAMPSAGGFSQTAINQSAGARTQLSELVTATLAVGCALFLGGVLSDLPQATLGCMVVVAVLGLIKPAEWLRLWRLGRTEFWVAAITAASGLCFGLLVAVAVGVALTLFLVIYELDHLGVTELQVVTRDGRRDVQVAGDDTAPLDGSVDPALRRTAVHGQHSWRQPQNPRRCGRMPARRRCSSTPRRFPVSPSPSSSSSAISSTSSRPAT